MLSFVSDVPGCTSAEYDKATTSPSNTIVSLSIFLVGGLLLTLLSPITVFLPDLAREWAYSAIKQQFYFKIHAAYQKFQNEIRVVILCLFSSDMFGAHNNEDVRRH